MINSKEIKRNPDLFVFLPILYMVWSDAVLTPTEVKVLKEKIRQQEWLEDAEREFLMTWLDPGQPPSADELKAWLALMSTAGSTSDGPDNVISVGIRLARQHGSTNSQLNEIGASLSDVENSLGLISREIGFQLGTEARSTFTEQQRTICRFDKDRMADLLDGSQKDLIERVRRIISRHEFTLLQTGDLNAHREQVLTWCRMLAHEGLGSIGYPTQYGGGGDMEAYFAVMETLSYHDLSLVVKFGVQFGLFGMSILFLGTEKHHKKYLPDIGTLRLPGCFAMTETGHGSNVRGIETTATYCSKDRTFIIHTPNAQAQKEFIGNAALHGRMATVFAKLVIGGTDYGVNAFLVPLRDETGKTLPGISIEDCGRKMGLNGVDNGIIRFDEVVIPYENMLDRFARIDENGKFSSPIASDNRRFFTMLGTLVGGRIGIPRSGVSAAKTGLAIAIRYGDQRRQFGPEAGSEVPILNYRTHQRRLMPLLANAYALHFALQHLTNRFLSRTEEDMQEIEALAAGLKAWATWNTTETLQECRECCGGKGYMTDNRIADLKNDTDVYTTFEGDNIVLMQLVAKSRLTEFRQEFGNLNLFGIFNYVAQQARTTIAEKNPFIVRNTDEEHLLDAEFHLNAFTWRERSILTSAARRLKSYIDDGMDSFEAFNQCQDHLVQVATAYVERVILEQFLRSLQTVTDDDCRAALTRLCQLFALSQIEKNKGWYLENGYVEGVKTKAIQKVVDRLCSEIRNDAVPLIDAFRIPSSCLAPIA